MGSLCRRLPDRFLFSVMPRCDGKGLISVPNVIRLEHTHPAKSTN